eukprot:CAMPEP_0113624414 /NCGR_PEP_ID=MMETSP0017_2-20120614/12581_1 /TAXON_ID=2856 /ORGANISM="Cylindrotheca closterium" /LENGTH=279 /DNA_ID=CAMNT_0000534435 /DNA_START=174 /DNA_END=1013 /DNA_ORIENTATION=+ /assembly_acc=CAM_ASM_000147
MSSSTSAVLVGSAALLVAAAAATSLYATADSTSTIKDIEDEFDESELITAEEVTKIFDRLFMEMQGVLAQLSQMVQQIQMSGQVIPEKQLRMMLKAEFERALTAKQTVILEEYDMDYDCLEEATWEFMEKEEEYPKVKKAVERFQKLWENVSGESVVGMRPGKEVKAEAFEILAPAKTVEAAEIYFDALTMAMKGLVEKFKEEGKDLNSPPVAQELHMKFASVANEAGEESLKSMGITQAQFQKSIEANASNPMVGRALAMLQMKQQQALMSMGVPQMG